jgi:hypothetical protein
MSIEPAPDWYIRAVNLRLLRGESLELPIDPEIEPSNVSDIRAARALRCIEICRKRGDFRERPF